MFEIGDKVFFCEYIISHKVVPRFEFKIKNLSDHLVRKEEREFNEQLKKKIKSNSN